MCFRCGFRSVCFFNNHASATLLLNSFWAVLSLDLYYLFLFKNIDNHYFAGSYVFNCVCSIVCHRSLIRCSVCYDNVWKFLTLHCIIWYLMLFFWFAEALAEAQRSQTIIVPTNDDHVRMKLREFGTINSIPSSFFRLFILFSAYCLFFLCQAYRFAISEKINPPDENVCVVNCKIEVTANHTFSF